MAYPRSARKSKTLDRERGAEREKERETSLKETTACWFIIKSASITLCNSQLPVKDVGVNRRVIRKGTRSLLCFLDGDFLYVFAFRDCLRFVLLPVVRCLPCNLFMHIYTYVYLYTYVCVCVCISYKNFT